MQGSNLVDEVMIPVRAAINRHVKNSDAKTDIYNRAYEAVMASIAAIEKMKKHDELQRRITELEKEIERLQSELEYESKLSAYARHDPDCADFDCTCGLDKIIAEKGGE